jgi:DNA repair photolyase
VEGEARTHEREVKGALRKALLAEPFLASRYSFSPYMACGHGCAYCDGRAERYWVEGEFDRDIVVRTNIAALLDQELLRLRERAPVSVGSGISDAYQPVEASLGLMRQAALSLLRHRYPASILTKSALISRDLDLWSGVNAAGGFNLYVSLVYADDGLRKIFEPGASPVGERAATMGAFKAAGCGVGVYAMPLLPWISDTPEAVGRLLDLCRSVGADFVMPGGLTLRPGRQKDFFMGRLRSHFPELVPRYEELYRENRPSGNCILAYRKELYPRLGRAIEEAGFAAEIPHRLYRGRMPLYDELHVLLCHMVGMYERRGTDVGRLRVAADRYRSWLTARKRLFNRRRRETQEGLEEELRVELAEKRLDGLLDNVKLADFLRQVALERRVFDYASLRLQEAQPRAEAAIPWPSRSPA